MNPSTEQIRVGNKKSIFFVDMGAYSISASSDYTNSTQPKIRYIVSPPALLVLDYDGIT